MLDNNELELVTKLNELLDQGFSVNAAAEQMGYTNSNTLYHQLYRRGYKIENRRRVVPIHAPAIEPNQEAA